MKNCKHSLLYIGIILFSVMTFLEQLCLGESKVSCFIKGLACGLEIVGAIVYVIEYRKNHETK